MNTNEKWAKLSLASESVHCVRLQFAKRRKNLKQQCEISTTDKKLSIANAKVFQHVPAPCRRFAIFRDVSVMFCVVSWFKMIHSLSLCCASCAIDMSVFSFWLKSLSFRKGSCWILNVPPWISFRMQWLWSTILMRLVFLVCKTVCVGGRHLPTSASEKSWCTSIFNRINANHQLWKQAH